MTNYNGSGEYLGGRRKRRSMRGGVAYGAQDAQDVYLTGGRKRRSMRGGVAYGAQDAQDVYLTGGRKRRSMRGGCCLLLHNIGGRRKRRSMRGGSQVSSADFNHNNMVPFF